jgi:hypothetical protein
MLILSFSLRTSMEVRRRQAGQVREGKLRYSLNRLFSWFSWEWPHSSLMASARTEHVPVSAGQRPQT